ncbi:MAG: hypothetical protein ACJAZS_000577 [Alteromonas naphthalenivorans]|jgi:hypothetical protein
MKKLIVGLLLLTVKTTVYGYIDPGTGSYLLQLLAAGLVGGLYGIKTYWSTIKSYFIKQSK